jgi:RND family efflux transporter MFP subunit
MGAAPPQASASAPPVSVTVVPAKKRDMPVMLEATGTVTPVASVEVRAQVTSVVTKVHVREGQFVKAGDLLFTLDARTDEANVARLQAQMAKDEASLADARRQLARAKELLAQNFVSQGAVDTTQALVDAQVAAVAADKAAVDAAKVPLMYARVMAPSAGRVGVVAIFAGSVVQANVTPLVTITQLDPMDVSFNVPQRYLGDVLAAMKGGGASVKASLPEGSSSLLGKLVFVDNLIDASSGTVKVKARFANREGKLWPGAFLNASMTLRTLKDAVVVPQPAIIQSARGAIVYAVEDGKAALRPVQVLTVQAGEAAVQGVEASEKIILDGRQNVRPGSKVVERPADASRRPGAGASAASGAAPGPGGASAAASPTTSKASAP